LVMRENPKVTFSFECQPRRPRPLRLCHLPPRHHEFYKSKKCPGHFWNVIIEFFFQNILIKSA